MLYAQLKSLFVLFYLFNGFVVYLYIQEAFFFLSLYIIVVSAG